MKHRFLLFLLFLSACAASGSIIPWKKSPAPPDVAKLVAEAATYQPGQSREPLRRLEELVGQSTSSAATRQALEAGLVQLLAPSATFEARRFACKQLGIIGSPAALPALAKLLHSDETASIACLALTTYPPGKADEILRAAFPAAPATARIQILNTLGDRRDSRSVNLCAQAAGDPERAVAEAALASLGKIGDPAAWRALASRRPTVAPLLASALTEATLRCAAGLAASGNRKAAMAAYEELLAPSQPVYVRRAALAALIGLDKDQGEQRILQTLRGSDPALKPVAIAAVRSLRSKGASQTFARQLPALEPDEQVWMIDSLAARPDPAARAAIANSLGSPNSAVRRAAIAALGRVGNSSSVPLLARALGNSNEAEERRALESALIGLGGGAKTDTAVLVELKQSSGATRAALVIILARRQGTAANPVLFEETDFPEPAVAQAAFRALASTAGAADVPALLSKLAGARDADVRAEAQSAASQAIGKIDDTSRRSLAVFDALRRPQTADARISLIALLPRCGDAQALALLKSAQADPDPRVRDTAVRALAEWPDASAWEPLVGVYRRGATEAIHGLALRGLVRLAGEENAHPNAMLFDRYRQLLDGAHTDADLRLILGALGGVADPKALPLVLPLLANAGVRPEAEVAVRKIAESIKAKHPQAAQEALQKLQSKP